MPFSSGISPALSRPLPSNLSAVACTTKTAALLLASVFGRKLVPALAVRPSLPRNARIANGKRELLHIEPSLWSQCFFSSLSPSDPLVESVAVNAAYSAPLGQRVRLSVSGEIAAYAPIIHLNAPRSPTAVIRFIVAIIINAVERHFRRGFSYIRKEVLELRPALANANAAPSIFVEMLRSRIQTPLLHSHPYRVNPRAAHSVCDFDHSCSLAGYTNGGNYPL